MFQPAGCSEGFQARSPFGDGNAPAAFLYAFDLLELEGQDLRPSPWMTRRKALAAFCGEPAPRPSIH
jgi:ATP-dependent DNA ligase